MSAPFQLNKKHTSPPNNRERERERERERGGGNKTGNSRNAF